MRANLQELAKVMQPISDERAAEVIERLDETKLGGSDFVAAEHEMHDEYWDRAHAIERSLAPRASCG